MFNTKINIGNNSFFVKFKKYGEDDNFISKKFVFIRKYYVMNNIIYDTEIFVFDKDIAKKVINDINNNANETSSSITFPYLDNKKSYYSNNYKNFNSSFNKQRFKLDEKSSDLYDIYDKNGKSKFIHCNEIRIYHPIEILKLKSIIHVDAYYNDIHFHFYCNNYENLETYVDDEFKIDNKVYSEYIKFYIPDVETLFGDDNYFCDDLSISEIETTPENENIIGKIINVGDKNLLPFSLIIKPFKIEKIELPIPIPNLDIYKKVYVDIFKTIENNYITSPINLTIYPYKDIDTENNLYILSDEYNSSTVTFYKGYHFRLSSRLGFNEEGFCSVINKFLYENSDKYKIDEAYSLYNNVTRRDYKEAMKKLYRKYFKKATYDRNRKVPPTDNSELSVDDKGYEIGYPANFDTYKEFYKDEDGKIIEITNNPDREDYVNEDYINDLETETDSDLYNKDDIKLIGYTFQISNDLDFKNIIYTINVEQDFIDDFTFNISNIFDSWSNMPDILVARSIFTDKYLGKIICSNRITITKEWFKYLVNNDFYNSDKISFPKLDINKAYLYKSSNSLIIKNKPDENDVLVTKNNLLEENFMDVSNGFNFIDKINCTIKKENKEGNFSGNNLGSVKILYKPIFFRVRDLQNIRIKSGVTQKIGINLSDYMTKVDSFKLNIESNEFKEISRNDCYVIFSINANLLNNNEGRYIITNEEDDYISDGIYTLY